MTAFAAAPGPTRERQRILCVDDEEHVLEGLRDVLWRSFDVCTARSGAEGIDKLRAHKGKFAIVISDMRMPTMSGASFLRLAQPLAPDATMMLLTGDKDLEEAIRVVNSAQLFRFLTKPCDPKELMQACAAGLGQYRIRTAERELLEQTLLGSVNALSEALAIVSPAAVGRSRRIAPVAVQVATAAGLADWWEVEVAASLSDLGAVSLPSATAERVYGGQPLSDEEREMVARIPLATRRMLGKIPCLEGVLAILEHYQSLRDGVDPPPEDVRVGALILRLVADLDDLISDGASVELAMGVLRSRDQHDRALLDLLSSVLQVVAPVEVAEIRCPQLRVGMRLAEDVRSAQGNLLVARGEVMTDQLIDRLADFPQGHVHEPLRVIVDAVAGGAADAG